ncbi:MAG: hypothetical protein ACP5OG_02505 [Candidatus Nanoarchaeia archaeon]
MDSTLKNALEKLAQDFEDTFSQKHVNPLDRKKTCLPKRIVFYSSSKIKNLPLAFNYLENCFLNTQVMIDNKIPIDKMSYYNEQYHKREGDYSIDLFSYLKDFKLNDSSFLP